ncbi:NlpC/P60 family protein [Paenibacillus alginolyticus]|uniref:NlpC/P60 family protein n=1 Tax=Paenibacillus alginolyticus TaxID=59839 RepID=A0ABT4GHF4_9BACL|nr:NlpC/P60 family protein [Paenibacillus alginolyticus]MCY9665477.1 NlpC/P60 family protein [Paenibacillus alginolyticus]MCY9695623.1 NlpC/P60 family protein [Paenibacillus alginolyticus]MEC0147414.1 NlpC/P60 family protein [Paenibacillus alginolyticus]
MKIKNGLFGMATFTLMTMMLIPATSVHAEVNQSPSVLLDGRPLSFQTPPVIENGYSLVPMRPIFEAEGAAISWDESTRTVTALKDGVVLTYRIGDTVAYKNHERLEMPVSGKIIDGFTMVPVRFISEALGNIVKWHEYSRSITISSAHDYETTIEYGVNLRDSPAKDTDARVLRLLSKSEKIHVIREIDANWLEVQTKDNTIGFISAAPMYTDYASPALAEKKADELLAYGSKFLGTPYEFGAASGQTNTFDCSSFVRHVFNEVLSIDLPRVSYDQAKKGKEISIDQIRKGDLLFFSARGLDIGHVGIYAGDGKILHTYSKELGVHIADFDEKWKKRFVTARRLF